MKLLTDITHIDREQWQALVDRSPVTSVFQTPEMYDFYQRLEIYDTFVIAIEDEEILQGLVVCVINSEGHGLRKRLCARGIINGGPLLAEGIKDIVVTKLLQAVVSTLKRHCTYIETRNYNDYSKWRNAFETAGFSYHPHYNFHIDTTSDWKSKMGKTRLYEVRRTLRENVSLEINPTLENVHTFYVMLQRLYKKKVKTPLPPLRFFEKIFEEPYAHYFIAQDNHTVIGGTLCVGIENQTLYEWYACGESHGNKHLFPTTLVTYNAIEYAAKQGHPCFDMMGAGSPNDGGYGVRDYKAQFGGTLVEHGRFLHINNKPVYFIGKQILTLLKKKK